MNRHRIRTPTTPSVISNPLLIQFLSPPVRRSGSPSQQPNLTTCFPLPASRRPAASGVAASKSSESATTASTAPTSATSTTPASASAPTTAAKAVHEPQAKQQTEKPAPAEEDEHKHEHNQLDHAAA